MQVRWVVTGVNTHESFVLDIPDEEFRECENEAPREELINAWVQHAFEQKVTVAWELVE